MSVLSESYTGVEVLDTDHRFVVNPFTREITSKSPQKDVLIQNDHNSERFTFEIPRYIEGRDVGLCNIIQVCYTNGPTTGVYTVDDLAVYPWVNDLLTCSWLISQNATANVGSLEFMLHFAQINDDASVEYAWNTHSYKDVTIAENMYNAESLANQYVDAVQQMKVAVENDIQEYVNTAIDSSKNSITMVDQATGSNYKLYISNGQIMLEESED